MTEQTGTPMRLMLDSASPGQAMIARVTIEGEPAPLSVFLLREDEEHVSLLPDEVDIQIRAGGFLENDVFVAAIVAWIGDTQYEVWLNYHNREHRQVFDDLAQQDRLLYAFLVDTESPRRMLVTPNSLQPFITESAAEARRHVDWDMGAFDTAKAVLQARYPSVMDLWNSLDAPTTGEPVDEPAPAPVATAAPPVAPPVAEAAPEAVPRADTEPCPRCAEDIPVGAKACPYCGTVFGQPTPVSTAAPVTATPPPPPPAPAPVAYPPPAPAPGPAMQPVYPTAPPPGYPPQPGYPPPVMAPQTWTYESGMGALSVMPPEIRSWNWGAFFLSWIWGIGNGTYIALLALIPYVGFVMPFVLGAKGNEWAWRNKRWQNVEHFRRIQRGWTTAGLVFFAALVALGMFASLIEALSQ